MRKIVHLDMDCFYAAVGVRDSPALRGPPVAVAWSGPRGVVLTANYEARRFGICSAIATRVAIRKCPELTLVTPRMEVYRDVSGVIREVFHRYTDLVESLSLDEAYLDVTTPKQGPPSGTRIAELIKREINEATGLTASAGVSYNKFLVKLASGMNKPDGLTVILPHEAQAILEALPVEAFHGVGPATARRLHEHGVYTGVDLKAQTLEGLKETFGKAGEHFHTITRRRTLPYLLTTSDDLCWEAEKLLRQLTLTTGVRLPGVGAEGFVGAGHPAVTQTFLFPPQT